MPEEAINLQQVSRSLLLVNILVAAVYFSWWLAPGKIGNPYLFGLLFAGEVYHLLMALSFWYTVWPQKKRHPDFVTASSFYPTVDVFIPVAGEPLEIVAQTALAAKNLDYPHHQVFILNDGYVAKKENWQEIETMAQEMHIRCFTRKIAHGAKAGNINDALQQTDGELVAIFDADMAPKKSFLKRTVPYFKNPQVGFVQTPQFYRNAADSNVAGGAWEQQEFFFGPVMEGKDSVNAAFICGTNVTIRRKALLEVGGMQEENIAEDFLTSLLIHAKGWQSYYLTDVLSAGLGPEDLLSYYKQQIRWAHGNLGVLIYNNPLFKKGLLLPQKIQYLASSLFYLNGLIVLADMIMPLAFLFTGIQPVVSSTTNFAVFFVPFMFLNLYTLSVASRGSLTFRAISFTHSSWFLQLSALKSALFREAKAFTVTPKTAQRGNFLFLAYPHLFYIFLSAAAAAVGIMREGIDPSVATNVAWEIFNIITFVPFINAAMKGENRV